MQVENIKIEDFLEVVTLYFPTVEKMVQIATAVIPLGNYCYKYALLSENEDEDFGLITFEEQPSSEEVLKAVFEELSIDLDTLAIRVFPKELEF